MTAQLFLSFVLMCNTSQAQTELIIYEAVSINYYVCVRVCVCILVLTFWHRNYFFNFSTPCI